LRLPWRRGRSVLFNLLAAPGIFTWGL